MSSRPAWLPWVRFADINNDKRHELIHVPYFGGAVRAWRNVNGLNGFPYPEAPKEIGQCWSANQTFFGEILP